MNQITYRRDWPLNVEDYRELLLSCTLGGRRPVDDPEAIAAMLTHSNLLVTAWEDGRLVGACRCFTDFRYVTYCADLAVRESHQRMGIGLGLLRETFRAAPCRMVLLSAPQAVDYYPRIGFTRHSSAWTAFPADLPPDPAAKEER